VKLATLIARLQSTQGADREAALKIAAHLLQQGALWSCAIHRDETPSVKFPRAGTVRLYCACCGDAS
jgi:hypothetical protein